jgi:N-ethylmaleimide reductase
MNQPSLFQPGRFGALELKNRVVMAPMTRQRADTRVPNALMQEYYRQRASAGLIVTEATQIAPNGAGGWRTPGIHSEAQIEGWKAITSAVHTGGGTIVLQLWHAGRSSHPSIIEGATPVAPSALAVTDADFHTPAGKEPYPIPRALLREEIAPIVEQFAQAARNAQRAGFDGVELHAANGYLIDQFLRDGSNHRNDDYGGSVANRTRFLLEVTEAVSQAWSADRVGVRLSPRGSYNDMCDSDPASTFGFAVSQLNRFGLAYLHLSEAVAGPFFIPGERLSPQLRKLFQGALIANGGFDRDSAEQALTRGEADAVAFGVPFLANPDLPRRLQSNALQNGPDFNTFYSPGPTGYVDYPALP